MEFSSLRRSSISSSTTIRRQLRMFFLLLTFVASVTSHVKLNVPRVRLPYFDSLSINFTLHVDTPGCYKWTVSRPNVVTLMTLVSSAGYNFEGSECSESVLVSAVPSASPCCPAHAIIFAEEVYTKETVRCDVVIDRLASLNIVTTTKALHLEEAPSKFTLRGYGVQGNEFSTLEGVPFKWWFEPGKSSTGSDYANIMRFIPFSESMYEASPAITELEQRKLQGSQVLIEGLKTGSGNILAKIIDPFYKNIEPAQVRIVMIANLVLEPREITVVPETVFPLQLFQIKHGRFVEIKLPSDLYAFEVSNTTVADYDKEKSLVTALAFGDSKIVVRDKHGMDMLGDQELPAGNVYVRDPKFLSITILPYRNFALVIGQEYEFLIEIYDADNQQFYVKDQIHVKTQIDSHFLEVERSSTNGTYHVATPVRKGTTKITAELDYIISRNGTVIPMEKVIRTSREVEIFHPISIEPKESILPCYHHALKHNHEVQLTASGGDGNFVWGSTNYSVVVCQGGVARTDMCGYANVTAAMVVNPNIKAHAKVYVLNPTKMQIMEHALEGEVGKVILVPVAFYTTLPDDKSQRSLPYTSSIILPLSVHIDDPNFYHDSKSVYPHSKPAYSYLPIIGNRLGSALVTVRYESGDLVLIDSVTVSTFKSLKVVEPQSLQTVLAVGSSRQVVFTGGPRPLAERGFYRNLILHNNSVAQFSEIKSLGVQDDLYVYEITCREIGETTVALEVGNYQVSGESPPVQGKATVQVICAEPAQIYFKVISEYDKDELSRCPLAYSSSQAVRLPVPNDEDTLVSVTVKDSKGRKFDNITSLIIEWEVSKPLVTFEHELHLTTMAIPMHGYISVGENFQSIIPRGESGTIEVTGKMKGYRPDIIKRLSLRSNLQLSSLTSTEDHLIHRQHSIELDLVGNIIVDPPNVTLFNHPSYETYVQVKDGSGYYSVNDSTNTISKFTYFENNKTILISPLDEGDGTITVHDLCLRRRRPAEVVIQVNGTIQLWILVPVTVRLTNVNASAAKNKSTSTTTIPATPMAPSSPEGLGKRLEGWLSFWSIIEFFKSAWSQIMFAVSIVIATLVFVHLASKYMFTNVATLSETESVFLSRTSPQKDVHVPDLLRERGSLSPSQSRGAGSGDSGYSTSQQRLYSTQDTGLYGTKGSSLYSRKSY